MSFESTHRRPTVVYLSRRRGLGRLRIAVVVLAVVVVAVLAAILWSASSTEPVSANVRADTAQSPSTPSVSSRPETDATRDAPPPSRRPSSGLDPDELVGIGELGLLPSLLQALDTGVECDFDDAFSTCQ